MKNVIIALLLCLVWGASIAQNHTITHTRIAGPTITVTSMIPNTSCGTNDGSVTVAGGNSYLWSNGQVTQTAANLAADAYSVTVTAANGCSADTSIILNGPSTPVIVSQPQSDMVCSGTGFSVNVVATGTNLTYQWKKNGYVINGATTDTYTVPSASSSNGGNYTCVVTSGTCSVTSAQAVILISNSPTANAGVDQYINYGSSVNIGTAAVSGNTYAWSNGATTATQSVNPSYTSMYTVTVTNQYLCTSTDSVKVTVIGGPLVATASATPAIICNNGTAQLSVTAQGGNGVYSYTWSPSTGLSDIHQPNPIATVTTTMLYTVTVTSGTQSTTAQTLVTIGASPIANAGVDQTLNLGDTTVLTATGGVSYMWSNGQNTQSIMVNPTITNAYTVTVTNAAGCTATDNVTVFVVGGPLVFVNTTAPISSSLGTTIHVGESTQLTVLVSGGTPPYTYVWTPTTDLSSSTVYNPVASPTQTTTYVVEVSDAAKAADITDSITITVIQQNPPTASLDDSTQEICLGDTAVINVTLTGEAPWNFTYSNGQGGTFPITTSDSIYALHVVPTTATSYVYSIISVSDANYSNLDNGDGYAQVIVHGLPTANAGNDDDVCAGQSIVLTASGGVSYSWSNNASTASTSVTPTTTTTYTVSVTDVYGCEDTDAVIITVNTLPTANAGNDQTICSGTPVTVNATGGLTYAWSGNISNGVVFTPTNTTTYTVTATNINGCTDTDQLTINVDHPSGLSIVSDTVCEGNSAILTATGTTPGGTFSWQNGAATTATTYSITNPPVGVNFYSVTYQFGVCVTSATGVVVVHPTPEVGLGPNFSICLGDNVTLQDTSGNLYVQYHWTPTANTQVLSLYPTQTATYSLTVTDAHNCTATDDVVVTVNPIPSINVNSDDYQICLGDFVTLTATGASNYIWSTTETGSQVVEYPTTTTTYIATGYNSFGCSSTDNVQIIVYQLPTANAGTDTSVCELSSTTLTASGGVNYEWSEGTSAASISVSPTQTTTYVVTVTDIHGCVDMDSVIVTLRPLPTVDLGNDITKCQGQSVAFNPAISNGALYQWSPVAGLSNSTIPNPTLTAQSNMTYTLNVQSAYGCVASDVITILVNALPQLSSASTHYYQCEADTLGFSVTLNNSANIGACTYVWSPIDEMISGSTTLSPQIIPVEDSIYTLTVTSAAQCSTTLQIQVDITKLPVADFSSQGNMNQVAFTNESEDAASYLWNFGDSTTSVEVSPSHIYARIGTYTVVLTATNGCGSDSKTRTVSITTIDVPEIPDEIRNISAFPNPFNDILTVTGAENVGEIQLFDALGQIIYNVKNTKNESVVCDLSGLAPGIYYVGFMTTKGNMYTQKVIKL